MGVTEVQGGANPPSDCDPDSWSTSFVSWNKATATPARWREEGRRGRRKRSLTRPGAWTVATSVCVFAVTAVAVNRMQRLQHLLVWTLPWSSRGDQAWEAYGVQVRCGDNDPI